MGSELVKKSSYEYVRTLEGWKGVAKVYKNGHGHHIVISRADTFDRGDETGIFRWDETIQNVSDWEELYFGYGETHQEALDNWQI